ncbi:MAG TPA: archease [Burkholderiales bacterium]|nr:archease [Burkholderiales bacterium]
MDRGYSYFEHDADAGVVGRGETPERAFEAAARGVFALMAEPDSLGETREASVSFVEEDLELALVEWLNALLGAAREQGAVFRRFALTRDGSRWTGRAWGEPWRDDMERGTEVKGATLTMLSVRQADGAWEARCVIDV